MRELVLRTCRVWVAIESAYPVGFLALRDDHVEHLYVRPGHQGHGVGGRLVELAKAASPGRLLL